MRRSLIRVTLALGLIASLSWSPSGDGLAQEKLSLKLAFATPPTTAWLPHFVAKDQGWLDRAGLHVEEVWLTGDANAVRAVLSGQVDVTATGVFATYAAITEGAALKAVASMQPRVDYQLLAHQKIGSVKDLAAARVGTAGPGGLTTHIPRMVMKKHNVDPSRASFVSIGGHDARMQAVVAGKVDVAIVGMLYASRAREFPNVAILTSISEEFPSMGYVYLVAGEKELANPQKRRAIETYVKLGIIEASRFIVKNPDRAAEIMQGRTPDLKLDLIKDVVRALTRAGVWGVNGGLEPEVTDYTLKLAHEMGSIKRALAGHEVIDRTIVDKLLGELGRM